MARNQNIYCLLHDYLERFKVDRKEYPTFQHEFSADVPKHCWHNRTVAQRTITTLVDDLDDSDLGSAAGETIRFGVDGRTHEIDLSDANAAALRQALQPYTEAVEG